MRKIGCILLLCVVLLAQHIPFAAAAETAEGPVLELSVPNGAFVSVPVTGIVPEGGGKLTVSVEFSTENFEYAVFYPQAGLEPVWEVSKGKVDVTAEAAVSAGTLELGSLLLRSSGEDGEFTVTLHQTDGTYSQKVSIAVFSYGILGGGHASDAVDALTVLQHSVGIGQLSRYQLLAGDLDGDGSLSSVDAMLILQWNVGLPVELPQSNDIRSFTLYENQTLTIGTTRMFRQADWSVSSGTVEVKDGVVTPLENGTAAVTFSLNGVASNYLFEVLDVIPPPPLRPDEGFYRGIDVSTHNGVIDWQAVKDSGVEFAIIRAGYGKDPGQEDKQFQNNYNNARAVGMPLGAYHFCYATSPENAYKEADNLLNILDGRTFEYPIFYDLEDDTNSSFRLSSLGKETITQIAINFTTRIRQAGYYPAIYCNLNWAVNYLDLSKLEGVDIWLAQWDVEKPTYQGEYTMWQYTSDGSVPGIGGRVDLNYCYVNYPKYLEELGLNFIKK